MKSLSSNKQPSLAEISRAAAAPWTSHIVDCGRYPLSPGNDTFVTTKTSPSFEMSIHPPIVPCYVSKVLRRGQCWECNFISQVQSALQNNPGAYFLDVGGNIGMWSLAVAAMRQHDVISIEPYPPNYEKICKTVHVNRNSSKPDDDDDDDMGKYLQVLNIAATSEKTNFTVFARSGNMAEVSVTETVDADTSGADGAVAGDKVLVQGYPIDSLGLPTDRPVVVKIDVEAHELDVLMGAKNYLCHDVSQVLLLIMEVRPGTFKRSPESEKQILDIFACLTARGLEPYGTNRYKGFAETKMDIHNVTQWIEFSYCCSGFFDVIWYQHYKV